MNETRISPPGVVDIYKLIRSGYLMPGSPTGEGVTKDEGYNIWIRSTATSSTRSKNHGYQVPHFAVIAGIVSVMRLNCIYILSVSMAQNLVST